MSVQAYPKRAGLPPVLLHDLRHGAATYSGVSIEVVRRLGHASTATTQVYALLADKVAERGQFSSAVVRQWPMR